MQGTNDFGNRGYDGPRPPREHTYQFTLYALDTTLELSDSATKQNVIDAMDGHILAQTQLTGTFAP
jgi:Raf kinase inhibitor-like YbhB/YbcL family protein